MINLSCSAAAMAASAVVQASRLLLADLEDGRRIDAAGILRSAMESAFGASHANGTWHWKSAYDACEAATVLFLRKFGPSTMRDRLRAYGLFSEVISWMLRMSVPTDAAGVAVLAEVPECYPVEHIGEREAA